MAFRSEIYGQKRYSELDDEADKRRHLMTATLRVLFLITFFILWSMLLSNVITGHIIDAFMEIRGDKDKKDQDMKENCFICSIDRYTFDQSGAITNMLP